MMLLMTAWLLHIVAGGKRMMSAIEAKIWHSVRWSRVAWFNAHFIIIIIVVIFLLGWVLQMTCLLLIMPVVLMML